MVKLASARAEDMTLPRVEVCVGETVEVEAATPTRRQFVRSASSSASSNTQHSTRSTKVARKRAATNEVCQPADDYKRRKASTAAYLPATSSSSSSNSNSDDEIDTAASTAKPLTVAEAQQLFACVERGEQSLQELLLLLLSSRGEQAFISFLRYLVPSNQQQQQQQQYGKQQQQQHLLSLHVFETLSANQHFLFCDLLQSLSHPDLVTCYNACLAFQSLVEAVGADQVLAAVLAAPQGLLLLLAALNERRLQQAYQQGYVMSVGYAAQCIQEPLCSGSVACMVKSARPATLQEFVVQLLSALEWQDECSVAAAMVLVIIAYNAAAGVAVLLPHMPLLLAAVQQHQRIGKRILLTLKAVIGSSSAAAAEGLAGFGSGNAAAAAVGDQGSHALIRSGINALFDLLIDGPDHTAALAADVIVALVRTTPGQHAFMDYVRDMEMVIQQHGPASLRSFKAVQMLHHIAAGSSTGAAAVLPCTGSILALQGTVVVLSECPAAARRPQRQQPGQLQIIIGDQIMMVINATIRQTAADLINALAQYPEVAAAALSCHPCVSVLLAAVRQLQQQQLDLDRTQSNVVEAILTAVRALAAVPAGQVALANAHDLGILLSTMQAGGPAAGLACDVFYKLVLAATNAVAAVAAAELDARSNPSVTIELSPGVTPRLTTPAAVAEAERRSPCYAGHAVTSQCARIADLMRNALSPDNIRLLLQAALNPSLTLRVFQSLILLCARLPQVTHLLAAHIPVLNHIVDNIIPELGLPDRSRLLLLKAVSVISRGAQSYHHQQQQLLQQQTQRIKAAGGRSMQLQEPTKVDHWAVLGHMIMPSCVTSLLQNRKASSETAGVGRCSLHRVQGSVVVVVSASVQTQNNTLCD